jgi:hypothetical protein
MDATFYIQYFQSSSYSVCKRFEEKNCRYNFAGRHVPDYRYKSVTFSFDDYKLDVFCLFFIFYGQCDGLVFN